MVEQARQLDGLIDEGYVPSSVERKKAVLMYFLIGIIAALAKERVSIYEFFHLKQSIGRWMVFFFVMIFGLILVFIPYLWIFPVLLFLIFMVVWVLFVKQAYEGRYVVDDNKVVMPFYVALGGWVISIFELEIYDAMESEDV